MIYCTLNMTDLMIYQYSAPQPDWNQHFCAPNITKHHNVISLACRIIWIFPSILHAQPCILESKAVPISLLALSRSDGLRPKPLWGLSTLPGTDILAGPAPPVPLPSPWGLIAHECPVPLNFTGGVTQGEGPTDRAPRGKRKHSMMRKRQRGTGSKSADVYKQRWRFVSDTPCFEVHEKEHADLLAVKACTHSQAPGSTEQITVPKTKHHWKRGRLTHESHLYRLETLQ